MPGDRLVYASPKEVNHEGTWIAFDTFGNAKGGIVNALVESLSAAHCADRMEDMRPALSQLRNLIDVLYPKASDQGGPSESEEPATTADAADLVTPNRPIKRPREDGPPPAPMRPSFPTRLPSETIPDPSAVSAILDNAFSEASVGGGAA